MWRAIGVLNAMLTPLNAYFYGVGGNPLALAAALIGSIAIMLAVVRVSE